MNKRDEIKSLNEIKAAASNLKEVASQCMALATRLECEAKTALKKMGDSKGQGRKAKHTLSPEIEMQVLGSLTKKGTNRKQLS